MSEDQPILPIRLRKEVIADLTDLIKNKDNIPSIISAAKTIKPASSIQAFALKVAQKTQPIKVGIVLDVLGTLINIKRIQLSRGVDAKQLIDILTISLSKYADNDWQISNLDTWKNSSSTISDAIESITNDHPLFVSEKAQTLALSDQNILTSQRIITEIRPVFDTAGQNIQETLILHKLLIEYYDGISRQKRIAFTLDSQDIKALLKSCQRAKGKTEVTKIAIKDLNPTELPETPEE